MLTSPSERDPTRTRNVLWTEPMVDLKTPLGDSAWALEIMNAEEDTDDGEDEIDLQPRKFSKAGPIGKRVETQNPRPSRGVANNVSYLDADYDEDEADGIDDEDFRELEDGFDGQASYFTSSRSRRVSTDEDVAPGLPIQPCWL